MVDYVPILSRAVSALSPNTSEQRHVLYDRARRVLLDNFGANDLTLSDNERGAESAALEAAIRRVEADAVSRSAPPKPPHPAYTTSDAPIEEYPDRPPLKDGRKQLRIVAGAFGALVILLACVAAYYFWPRVLFSARSIVSPQSLSRTTEQPIANTGYVYLRQPVYYRTTHPAGTIIIDKLQSFLYVVRQNVSALRYGIGVGPECTTLAGLYQVVRKEEWPGWKPPLKESADTGYDKMKNPLGARALYLNKNHRIHGTNVSATIGQRVLQGCIRLVNDDVIYLYDRTPLENRVVVLN